MSSYSALEKKWIWKIANSFISCTAIAFTSIYANGFYDITPIFHDNIGECIGRFYVRAVMFAFVHHPSMFHNSKLYIQKNLQMELQR